MSLSILALICDPGLVINNPPCSPVWVLILFDFDTALSLTFVDEFLNKPSFWKSLHRDFVGTENPLDAAGRGLRSPPFHPLLFQ